MVIYSFSCLGVVSPRSWLTLDVNSGIPKASFFSTGEDLPGLMLSDTSADMKKGAAPTRRAPCFQTISLSSALRP